MFHNATHGGRGLSSGTSPERIAPESVTAMLSGFVHRNISRGAPNGITRSSLTHRDKPAFGGGILNVRGGAESNQKRGRVKRDSAVRSDGPFPLAPLFAGRGAASTNTECAVSPPHPKFATANFDLSPQAGRGDMGPQFVFATLGGVAVVMNDVASSIAGPSGVGIFIQNGTRMRVPATGANAISMLRWAVRYLITARSGI